MYNCQSVHPVIDLKVGVLFDITVYMYRYALLLALWKLYVTFQARNNTAIPKFHTEAITCVLQIVTYKAAEKGMEYKGEQRASFGRTMMQALELLQLAKGTSQDEAMSNSTKIKPIAFAVSELRLYEGISEWVSEGVGQSVENLPKYKNFKIV